MYEHRVQYYETDRMGITHHSNYIRWMEEARVDFLDRLGWSYARLEAEGIISPVVSVECRYQHSTTFCDRIRIEVSVEGLTGAKLKLLYRMTGEDGKTVCTGRSEHCFLNPEGRILRLNREYPAFHAALAALAGQAPPEEGTPDAV